MPDRIDPAWLAESSDGLIALSGGSLFVLEKPGQSLAARDIVAGQRDAHVLARHRNGRIKATGYNFPNSNSTGEGTFASAKFTLQKPSAANYGTGTYSNSAGIFRRALSRRMRHARSVDCAPSNVCNSSSTRNRKPAAARTR